MVHEPVDREARTEQQRSRLHHEKKQHARVPRIPGALCGMRRPTRRSRCDSWQLFHLFDSAWGSGLKGRAWSLVARIDLGTNCSPSKLFSIV